ncbi:FBF1 factor, partial [Pachyramphus minor]|nr:FBF1 factor [Pachyramphus minor]
EGSNPCSHSRVPQRSERQSREGERALQEARALEEEQRERLRAGREQLEQLREQEQRLEQARLSLAQQRRQLQRLRQELAAPGAGTLLGPERLIPRDEGGRSRDAPLSPPAAPGAPGLLPGFLPPVGMILGGTRDPLSGSAALHGHLLLLKHRARM